MSLAGNLEDLALADVFQIVALSGKSGLLSLRRASDRKGTVVVQSGRIVSAWVPNSVEMLADIMSAERLTVPGGVSHLDPDDLNSIGKLYTFFSPPIFTNERRRSILELLTKAALVDMFQWKRGTFEFELRGNHDSEPPLPDTWILLPEGLAADHMTLEGARVLDETQSGRTQGGEAGREELPPVYAESLVNLVEELSDQFEQEAQGTQITMSPGLNLLKSMLFELNAPNVHTSIVLMVLRYASALMNRAILFEVRDGTFKGLGEFGIGQDKTDAARLVRSIEIPRTEPSFLRAIEPSLLPVKVIPDPGRPLDRKFFDLFGSATPPEIFLGPLVCEGRLVAVLYGDNLPEFKPIGNTETLEIFLSQAGIAMERALRERAYL